MQATLLSLAIALILALVAALVGPLFVDWSQYRETFETRASAALGMPVRVSGAIDARILPAPTLRLQGVDIGAPDDSRRIRARSLDVELGLGPLLRGEVRAVQVHLNGPEFGIGLDGSGRVDWPALSLGFIPASLAIEQFHVSDGRAVLTDAASGSVAVLDQLSFDGDVRSLAGPVKGEGTFLLGGKRYPYRLTTGRLEDGVVRLRAGIDPTVERPVGVDLDGTLTLANSAPGFEGTVTLARPAGIARPDGQTLLSDPWRAVGRVKASSANAKVESIEFQYGAEEAGLKLTGTAEATFGARPLLNAVLSGRQLDLDRVVGAADGPRSPLAAMRSMAQTVAEALRLPIRTQLGFGVDSVTLGGASIQTVRGDLSAGPDSWSLDSLEFRAPGFTHVRASGRVDATADGPRFKGPADIETGDPRALLSWLAGLSNPGQVQIRQGRLRGEVTLGGGQVAVERLRAEFDREAVEGRVAYVWARPDQPSRLDAELKAGELDIDALQAFADAALAGTTVERPRDVTLAVQMGRARYAGIDIRQVNAKLQLDADGLRIERLAVADLGGAAVQASGRVALAPSPRGTIALDLDAARLDGVTAVLGKFAPQAAERVQRMADRLSPAKLRMSFDVADASGGADKGAVAKINADGKVGAIGVKLTGDVTGDPKALTATAVRFDGRFDADDGAVLFRLAGLERFFALDKVATRLTLTAEGPVDRDLRMRAEVRAGALAGTATGTLRLSGEASPAADLRLALTGPDIRPLWRAGTGKSVGPLPANVTTRLLVTPNDVKIEDLGGTIAGTGVRGRLGIASSHLDGEIGIDTLDVAPLIAAAIGMPLTGSGSLSPEPFGQGFFGDVAGTVVIKAPQARFAPALVAKDMRGVLRVGSSGVTFEDVTGTLGEGRLAARLSFTRDAAGLTTNARMSLTDAQASAILPGGGRPPVIGTVRLDAEINGTGRSPAALIGALSGGGSLALDFGQFASLDPRIFDNVMRAADQVVQPVEPTRLRDQVSKGLDQARLRVPHVETGFVVSGTQLRAGTTIARGEGADATLSGSLDLANAMLDARVTLSRPAEAGSIVGGRPEVSVMLKGPVTGPTRTVDVTMLAGWLTLRAIEQQSRQLEAIASSRRDPATEVTAPTVTAPTVAAPPVTGTTTTGTTTPAAPAMDTPIMLPRPRPVPETPAAADEARTAPPSFESAPALPPPLEIRPQPDIRSPQDRRQSRTPARTGSAESLPRPAFPPLDMQPPPGARSLWEIITGR